MTAFAALLRLTQTMMVGGSSVTEHTAEQVKPAMPCGPSVEMIDTEEATRDIASRNSAAVAPVMNGWTWTLSARDRISVGASIFLSISSSALPESQCVVGEGVFLLLSWACRSRKRRAIWSAAIESIALEEWKFSVIPWRLSVALRLYGHLLRTAE